MFRRTVRRISLRFLSSPTTLSIRDFSIEFLHALIAYLILCATVYFSFLSKYGDSSVIDNVLTEIIL